MNQKFAKKLRRLIGSLKTPKQYLINKSGVIFVHPESNHGVYKRAKKAGRTEQRAIFGQLFNLRYGKQNA